MRLFFPLTDSAGNALTGKVVTLFNATGSEGAWGWGTEYGVFSEDGSTGMYYIDVATSGNYGIKWGEDASSLNALGYTLGMRVTVKATIDGKMDVISNPTDGGILVQNSSGDAVDSGVLIVSLAGFSDSATKVLHIAGLLDLLGSTQAGRGVELLGWNDPNGRTSYDNLGDILEEIYGIMNSFIVDISSTVLSLIFSQSDSYLNVAASLVLDGSGDAVYGMYTLEYFYHDGEVTNLDWDNLPAGVTRSTIAQGGCLIQVPKPMGGNAVYTNDDCRMYCRVKFHNVSSETAWTGSNTTVEEPLDTTALAAAIITKMNDDSTTSDAVLEKLAALQSKYRD